MSDATGKWQAINPDSSVHRCGNWQQQQTQVQTPQVTEAPEKTPQDGSQNGKPMIGDDATANKGLANRVTLLNERLTYVENELRKLKEWLAVQPMK